MQNSNTRKLRNTINCD